LTILVICQYEDAERCMGYREIEALATTLKIHKNVFVFLIF